MTVFMIFAVFMTIPASAQVPGDLDCNGFMDVADLVKFLKFLDHPCGFWWE
jgi:hypothetical protein